MKIRLSHSLFGKIVATLFAVAVVLFGVYWGSDGVTKVYAADILSQLKIHESGDFYYVPFTDKESVKDSVGNQVPGTAEGYVFAGWYTDIDCTEAIKNDSQVDKATTDTFYAKYVLEDVLSTKVQISTKDVNPNDGDGVDTRNMRFVSSVDNLNYRTVGFALKYEETEGSNEWKKFKNEAKIVFERIESATEGDEYKFSPKVVDTKSEYFMTATWKGEDNASGLTNFETNYYVRAYWVTLDGVAVYGPTRYVSVNDGLNTNIVNMSVKNSNWNTDTDLTVSLTSDGVTADASVAYQDNTYAHLKINLKDSEGNAVNREDVLDSLTQFTITNTADSTSVKADYRNLYTKYEGDGTEDTSWYDIYTTTPKEYVIATAADLYGLASLVNNPTYFFGTKTVYLVADIEVNKGRATADAWSTEDENGNTIDGATSTPCPWTPIGTVDSSKVAITTSFQGRFDGQGHTISGLYTTTETYGMGLFGCAHPNSEIRDFRLTNSLFKNGTLFTGSIVGVSYGGNIDTVYSDAFVTSSTTLNGGLVGAHWDASTCTISNSCYAGTITVTGKFTGGLVGKQNKANGELQINDCLFSGTLSFSNIGGSTPIGGFVGNVVSKLTIANCLNSGQIIQTDSYNVTSVGRITGENSSGSTVSVENVYYTDNGFASTTAWTQNGTLTEDSVEPVMKTEEDITGMCAYYNKILVNTDATDAWIVTKTTPQLAAFGEELTKPDNADITWFEKIGESDYTICNYDNNNAANVAELYGFSFLSNAGINFEGSTVYMANDVTVNAGSVSDWETNGFADLTEWTPIGEITNEFAGNFDGGMNTIKGIYVNNTSSMGTGLFKSIAEGCSIKNLRLENSYFYTNKYFAGSVVGNCSGSVINVYSSATVEAAGAYSGGIIGQVWSNTSTADNQIQISNCWFAGELRAKSSHMGGIVGLMSNGYILFENCLNTGSIQYSANWIGGLIGRTCKTNYEDKWNNGTGTDSLYVDMNNCLNVGELDDGISSLVGSIIGRVQGDKITATNVYATNESYVNTSTSTPTGVGTNSMGISYTMLDESDITGLCSYYNKILVNTGAEDCAWVSTKTTPALSVFTEGLLPDETGIDTEWYQWGEEKYYICTHDPETEEDANTANIEELYGFAYLVDQGITFDDKIVYMSNDVTVNQDAVEDWDTETGEGLATWTPIGEYTENYSKAFAGIFDGQMHSISGLYGKQAKVCLGLFAQTTVDSCVQNLKLENSYFENTMNYTGSIVGWCEGDIKNVYSDATVNSSKSYNGGIIGYTVPNSNGINFTNCWFDGNIKASGTCTGGIVGLVDGAGEFIISNCLNSGDIANVTSGSSLKWVGGLCGRVHTCTLTISDSLNVGEISGSTDDTEVGSIIGSKNGPATVSISNVYTTNESYKLSDTAKATGMTMNTENYCICAESDITGNLGYFNIDFARGDVWAITAATPELEAFSTAKVADPVPDGNIDWYTGLVDSTFTICAEEDENATKVDKLYGFAFLVDQGVNFAEKTVNLGQDVTVNEGTVYDEWDKVNGTYNEVALTTWDPIGAETKPFAGNFNGSNKTISGLYNAEGTTFLGLFARVDTTGKIQNLKLEDSYFSGSGQMGSIAGRLDGSIDTVYSNADITTSGVLNGGIAGYKNSTTLSSITNCCYAGTINMGTAGAYIGGIIGRQISGELKLQDCLFSGNIEVDSDKNRTARIGGFVGNASKKLTINTSVSSGTITNDSGYTVYATCPVIGYIDNAEGVIITCDSVYYTEEGYTTTDAWYRHYTEVDGEKTYASEVEGMDPVLVAQADIAGSNAFYNTNLDFEVEKGWALVSEAVNGADGTPVLKSFVDASAVPALPEVPENADIKWYKGLGVNTYTICNSEDDNSANVKELYGFEHLVNDIGIDFSGKTVSMANDVEVNEGAPNTYDAWTTYLTDNADAVKAWTPIGTEYEVTNEAGTKTTVTETFAGTFDGNNHSISGLYAAGKIDYMGFFGVTGYGSKIKNFKILNSYFNEQAVEANGDSLGFVGSVAGELRGSMSNVYSNAIVESSFKQIGGMVARTKCTATNPTPVYITNCWFDGTVIGGTTGRYMGGIVATIVRGICEIENVLFTGVIDSDYITVYEDADGDGAEDDAKAVFIGGIVGETAANSLTLNLKSVLSAGEIIGTHDHSLVNAVIGRVKTELYNNGTASASGANPTVTFENVFATRDCYETACSFGDTLEGTKTNEDGTTETITSKVTTTGAIVRTTGDDRLIGYIAQKIGENVDEETGTTTELFASLDFEATWSMRTNDVPVLKCFEDMVDEGTIVSSVDATTLAKEIGLDYWKSTAKITDAEAYGGGNYLVSYTTSEELTYDEYIKILGTPVGEQTAAGNDGLGFTRCDNKADTDMEKDGIINATYKSAGASSEWVLNITYVETDKTIYISINTDENSWASTLKSDNALATKSETDTKTISLSMLEMVNDENNPYGNSFVFQLPNGHFIVNDGGRAADGVKLIEYLRDQAKAAGLDKVYIDAWIVSHYHDDHCGALGVFTDHPELREGVYVEAVYASEPSTYSLDAVENQLGVVNVSLKGVMTLTKADGINKPDVYQLHMGQRYYFNGMTMDVIDTQEQHHVSTWDDYNEMDTFNASSTNCVFTFKDASDVTKKVLIGGDSTNVNMEYMMKVYGENNYTLSNIDVFAAYHHGHNTSSTFGEETIQVEVFNGLSNVDVKIKARGTKEWANFLLYNTNNDDEKFDVVLFPYYKIYEMSVGYYNGERYYVGDDGNIDFPYNIREMNEYLVSEAHASAYYTYGYDDCLSDYSESNPHGTVKITFDGSNTATVFGKGVFSTTTTE